MGPTSPNPTPAPPTRTLTPQERELLRAKYILFNRYALEDQRAYYNRTLEKNRKSASQVNFIRASFALLTIVVAGIATYIVQTRFVNDICSTDLNTLQGDCLIWRNIVNLLLLLSIVFPALGAFFNMLADLFQWDRLVQIYDEAVKSLEIPDALSPDDEMPDDVYRASLELFASTTLGVMRDESGQWGQLIGTPENLAAYKQRTLEAYQALEAEKLGENAPGLTVVEPEPDSASPPPPASPTMDDPINR
jgi:hypothetical protein